MAVLATVTVRAALAEDRLGPPVAAATSFDLID